MQRRKAVKMQKEHIGSRERNAMLKGGIWGVFFYAFSSKKAETKIPWNHSIQSCSEDFQCCSFTGKERDEETGYGYFGARYMDHELMTGWLSVDPMADKYPSISPYAYCAWNPVKLIDPDGCEIGDYFDKNGNHLGTDNKKDAKIFILKERKSISEKDDFNKDKTREKFTEVEKSSNLYALISAVYAEMGGADKDSKQIVAESIYNRANLPGKKYEKADGTYKGVIKKAYDVANPKNKRFDYYINPQNHIYSNPVEYKAWIESASVAIRADRGLCNLGDGVIFYNSVSSTIYDQNKGMEKIQMPHEMSGIKGMWKLSEKKQ